MPRKGKFIPTPSRLSEILVHLKKDPKPQLRNVKGLKITYAFRNDHWGARHFVKDELPRIQYANPKLDIVVNKLPKTKEDNWKPELLLQLRDGTTRSINVDQKWSSTIFTELMDAAGGPLWAKWKESRQAAGLPVIDVPKPKAKSLPPSLKNKKVKHEPESELQLLFDTSKTGAAAILP